jgi:hypothetical protein
MRRRGIGRTMARTAVIAGTATAVSGHVARRQDARYRQQAADEVVHQPAPAPVSVAEELKKFAALTRISTQPVNTTFIHHLKAGKPI